MPQLDTSTWSLTITLMLISLFCVYQMKMINQTMISITPYDKKDTTKPQLPWEKKWTKIYLPHSLPLPL
uniref:ATP synthase complex subunit 8 n=1 Tax=Phalanger orientalis TaxID=42473 RepID=A0A7T1NM15_PHAOR|nr:ATP synthase F0 subunit 8 [Phalanger orientalis]QPO06086.1 ATP synthase F0 subunit 8 [Phalanger orientalis]QPO06099.1 ATP synthase F0 subunit 8 [Phalanger orientalis]QPO06112.1 ATP synthase F0 subunit 8 [Phalanger orientalis]QPO06125.1 ATP synthase F0 subunit 8 [Phalanger orientalis]QPO06138.1 ATP synthase F0 subunit 8 [Phalanger orientalis]